MKILFNFALLMIILNGCTPQPKQDKELTKLFSDYKEYIMRNYPEGATYDGDHRYDNKLTDLSESGVLSRLDSIRNFYEQLKLIDSSKLSDENKLNYHLVADMFQETIEGSKFQNHLIPLTQQDGIHIGFPQIIESQPFNTPSDFHHYFERLKGFDKQVTDVIELMNKGVKLKIVPPKFSMEQVLTQIEAIKNSPTDSIPFMKPVKSIDSKWKHEDKLRVINELTESINTHVKPSYQKLYDYITGTYLPNCRDEDGVWSIPNGVERYQFEIKHETTTDMNADEIFTLGMSEVQRIQVLMEKLKQQIGFEGTLQEFNKHLLTDSAFWYSDKDKMLNDFREILHKVDGKLPSLFGRLPKAPYALKEMEMYRAKSAPQAYYYAAPEDRSRPGYFYVNTFDLPSRPKFTMTSLAMHEAVPGHHLQISIAQELESLPWVRRQMGFTAFVEGWALYSESLGYETGMYDDVYQRYGALTFEMWRACRLVVDAGIHSKHWTREQGVQFMLTHASNSELDTRSEVDRYIVWPAQALAYKIGELTIKSLRKKAETELGTKFNIKKFHDAVLENGAIPLAVLEMNINKWIARQKKK